MIPAAVRYHRAESLEDALAALAEPEAKVLAGGQSLLPVLKLRIARPSVVVDVSRLDLSGVELRRDALRIGALTIWDDLARAPELERPAFAGIAECASAIGDLQVRNRGTVGGSLAHADPSSDMPAALLALGAAVVLLSAAATRTVPLGELFLGPFLTAVGPEELLTEILVPVPAPGTGSAYGAVEHPASGFALVGAGALVRPDGGETLAFTGLGASPFVLDEELPTGLGGTQVFGDGFASAEYKRALAVVVAERALDRARARAREDAEWHA